MDSESENENFDGYTGATSSSVKREMTPEEKRAYRREWARQDRIKNPEKYKEIDAKKQAKRKEKEQKAGVDLEDRERRRIRAQERREEIKADPELYAAYLEKERARTKKRQEAGETKCTEEQKAAKRQKYYDNKDEVLADAKERYHEQREAGTSQWDKIKADPVKHEEHKEKLRERNPNYYPVCGTCEMKHCSKNYDECYACRAGKNRVKLMEDSVKEFLRENDVHFSLHDVTGPCSEGITRRADFVFVPESDDRVVILEVDENEHLSYSVECEVNRMGELQDQYKGKHVFFVRYNPRMTKGKMVYDPDLKKPVYNKEIDSNKVDRNSLKSMLSVLRAAFVAPFGNTARGYTMLFVGYSQERIKAIGFEHDIQQQRCMMETYRKGIKAAGNKKHDEKRKKRLTEGDERALSRRETNTECQRRRRAALKAQNPKRNPIPEGMTTEEFKRKKARDYKRAQRAKAKNNQVH